MEEEYLFVYGTLMHDSCNLYRELMECADYIRSGYFKGQLFNLGDFPGAIQNDKGIVYGNLLKIHDVMIFNKLDNYEGDLYEKILIDINGTDAWCYIYTGPTEGYPLIEKGLFTIDMF